VKETESRSLAVTGRLLDVTKKGTRLYLDINFDPQIITLFKVRLPHFLFLWAQT
jgi:hypothetical protein